MFTIPRENRTIPFLISIGGIVLSWFLFRESLPWIAERILIVGLLNGIALAITRFEKMSLHVYACVLVSVLWIPQFSGFTFILLPLIVWARLELKAHTWIQMIMGAAAGLILGCMIGYIGKNFEFNI